METDMIDEEPSVLQYARLHGISIDYTIEPLHFQDVQAPSNTVIHQDLEVPSDHSIARATGKLIKEPLSLNKHDASFLRLVHDLRHGCCTDDSFAPLDKRSWLRDLKQEAPLLQTDCELDLLSFGSDALPDLSRLNMALEVTDQERGEGLSWPSEYHTYPARYEEQAKSEKIAISKDVLVYLQDTIQDTHLPDDSEKVQVECLTCKSAVAMQITPPLLPMSPSLSPYVPSSPTNRLPLPASSSDSLAAELKDIENHVLHDEHMSLEPPDCGDLMLIDFTQPPQSSLPNDYDQMLPDSRFQAENLKVEGPLTPPIFSTSPTKKLKCVSFTDTLHELIPNEQEINTLADEDGNSSIDFDAYIQDMEPLVAEVRKSIENETLSGVDTTARVQVPKIDFSLPIAPWDEYRQNMSGKHRSGVTELDLQMNFLLRAQHDELRSVATWPGLASLERELRWSIFTTNVTSIDVNEQLHGESDLQKILDESLVDAIATSSSQLWKREGLRILDDEDEDEEETIDFQDVEDGSDIETLSHKRKAEIDDAVVEAPHKKALSSSDSPGTTHGFLKGHIGGGISKISTISDTNLTLNDFSITTALHNFMRTRGKCAGRVNIRKDTQFAAVNDPASRSNNECNDSSQPMLDVLMRRKSITEQQPAALFPDLPSIPENLAPCSFIVSCTLLHRRNLMKQIESPYPMADILYRDYDLPHSSSQEADMVLSPSTGLILVTLQQIKQQELPGQPKQAPVKERIIALHFRYERLVVMISEGLSREVEAFGPSRPKDHRSEESLHDFENFAAELEGEVLIRYVPGGEQALARFTLIEMIKYGLPHGSADIGDMKLLAAETSWEVFLRRVGLNPYAAQVIIISLKEPVVIENPAPSHLSISHHHTPISLSGLSAFLFMSADDRVLRFQTLMGGNRVLGRISKIVDQKWISAVNDFQL